MRSCRVRTMSTPIFGASQISIAITCAPQRAHTSSGTGYFDASVLLIASETEKHATAPTIIRIATDGMCAWWRVIARGTH